MSNKLSPGCNCWCCTCIGNSIRHNFKAASGNEVSLKVTVSGLPSSVVWVNQYSDFANSFWDEYTVTGLDSLNGDHFLPIPTNSAGCVDEDVGETDVATVSAGVSYTGQRKQTGDPCVARTGGSGSFTARVKASFSNTLVARITSDRWSINSQSPPSTQPPTETLFAYIDRVCSENWALGNGSAYIDGGGQSVDIVTKIRTFGTDTCGLTPTSCTDHSGNICAIGSLAAELVEV